MISKAIELRASGKTKADIIFALEEMGVRRLDAMKAIQNLGANTSDNNSSTNATEKKGIKQGKPDAFGLLKWGIVLAFIMIGVVSAYHEAARYGIQEGGVLDLLMFKRMAQWGFGGFLIGAGIQKLRNFLKN